MVRGIRGFTASSPGGCDTTAQAAQDASVTWGVIGAVRALCGAGGGTFPQTGGLRTPVGASGGRIEGRGGARAPREDVTVLGRQIKVCF
jgi:hypothetical protein